LGFEQDVAGLAVGCAELKEVVDEVELDLETAPARVHERRREPTGRDVERDVPPVVDQRRRRQSDLADDLEPLS
jgi:hypothetical protein